MKYFFGFVLLVIIFITGSWYYLTHTYPQTSVIKSGVYYAQHMIKPHATLNKHIVGFMPFWQLENADYVRPELLSEINYFSITADGDGHLIQDSSEPGWRGWTKQSTRDLITKAHINGTEVTATVAVLNNDSIESIVSSENAQKNLTSELIQFMKKNKLDGINIDFEYFGEPDEETVTQFTQFSKRLRTAMQQETPKATLSLSIMPRAARDPDIYDFKKLSSIYDYFIGMSYEYYAGTAEFSAPVAPMRGYKDKKYFFDVETTYEDYAAVLPKEKLIMGVPYYGWERAVEDGPTINSATFPDDHADNYSAVMSYGRARETKEINPKQCKWDDYAMETWCWYTDKQTGVDRQVWLPDNRSVKIRYEFAKKQQLGGIAIWTLGYDKNYPDLWDMIKTIFSN